MGIIPTTGVTERQAGPSLGFLSQPGYQKKCLWNCALNIFWQKYFPHSFPQLLLWNQSSQASPRQFKACAVCFQMYCIIISEVSGKVALCSVSSERVALSKAGYWSYTEVLWWIVWGRWLIVFVESINICPVFVIIVRLLCSPQMLSWRESWAGCACCLTCGSLWIEKGLKPEPAAGWQIPCAGLLENLDLGWSWDSKGVRCIQTCTYKTCLLAVVTHLHCCLGCLCPKNCTASSSCRAPFFWRSF